MYGTKYQSTRAGDRVEQGTAVSHVTGIQLCRAGDAIPKMQCQGCPGCNAQDAMPRM